MDSNVLELYIRYASILTPKSVPVSVQHDALRDAGVSCSALPTWLTMLLEGPDMNAPFKTKHIEWKYQRAAVILEPGPGPAGRVLWQPYWTTGPRKSFAFLGHRMSA